MNQHSESTEARINQVLDALRHTQVPSGLEDRIANRLAATKAYTPSRFAVVRSTIWSTAKTTRILFAAANPYAFVATALTLLLAVSSVAFLSHRKPHTTAQSTSVYAPAASQAPTQPVTLAQTQPSGQIRSNGHHQPAAPLPRSPAALTNPAATKAPNMIALAETLAPSHPAPPMPLTQQELLMLSATRQGQPIEVAELDGVRETALRSIAEARERANLRRYLQGLLSSLATAQALSDTSPPPSTNAVEAASGPEPPTPSSQSSSQ